ncbi:MAG: hypothetical protein DRQ37_04515 [Gammaproteobacteria bacterium]|nr:MAG: hypothetical protein DRQ37_04515 [Gammaproteobacteria bacterium]
MDHASVHLNLRSSRRLIQGALFVHFGAITCLTVAEVPWYLKLVGGTAIFLSFIHMATLHLLRVHPSAVCRLAWNGDTGWHIWTRGGDCLDVHLCLPCYLQPWLTILRFKPRAGGRTSVALLVPDNSDEHAFRRLRILLRCSLARVSETARARSISAPRQ